MVFIQMLGQNWHINIVISSSRTSCPQRGISINSQYWNVVVPPPLDLSDKTINLYFVHCFLYICICIYVVQVSMLCNRRLYWPALREIWELLNSHNWTLKQKCIVTNNYTRTKFLSKVFKLTKVDCSKWEEEQLAKVPFLKKFLFKGVLLKFLTEKRSFATCNMLKPFA